MQRTVIFEKFENTKENYAKFKAFLDGWKVVYVENEDGITLQEPDKPLIMFLPGSTATYKSAVGDMKIIGMVQLEPCVLANPDTVLAAQKFVDSANQCYKAVQTEDSKEPYKAYAEKDANWPDPTPAMLNDPVFEAIWNVIKTWDINVPAVYKGYCGATGNHVRAIHDAVGMVIAALLQQALNERSKKA